MNDQIPLGNHLKWLKALVRNFCFCLAIGCLFMIPQPAVSATATLDPGDPAPALNPAKWLKGVPITRFETGQVYVVEFWATWCGPCKANIPHLTELAHQYKDRVAIAGISIWESTDPTDLSYVQKVENFVRQQGDKMDYCVAVDGPQSAVANAWMAAAGEKGIPASFIVGKDGRIAWIGYPANLGDALQQVLADKFDVPAARSRRDLELKMVRPLNEAMAAKDYKRALELIDTIVARQPELAPAHAYSRLISLYHTDLETGIALSNKILTEADHDIGAYRMMASIFATQTDLSPAAYKFGQGLMAEALKKEEMTYLFLAMNAELCANMGDKAGAAQQQEQAVAAAEKDSHAPPDFVEGMKKKLAKFKAAL
jgi:thiol-disulfide isomerase/thioredoxin